MPKVHANGINQYYEEAGQGEPLVFIHGLGSNSRDWENQAPEFARSYRVITYDLRGHGQSDKPEGPYLMAQYADDLAGLLNSLQIESAHIVGISLGGGIVLQFAIDHPQMVKTLTVVNSGPTLGDPEQVRPEIERRVGIVQQMGMRAMGENLAGNLFPKPEQADLRATFVERWAENDPRAYIEATRSMLDWNVVKGLASIQSPTLIIAADQDYSPVAAREAYAGLIPDARLVVIPDSRHATPVERPQEFNAVLKDFLDQHSGT
jgi:pimeloyl-ACP methyl ester carboxylesterase